MMLVDYGKLEFLNEVEVISYDEQNLISLSKFKIKDVPAINIYVDIKDNEIVQVEIDEEENNEIDYRVLHWWSDWCGDEVGYDDVLVVGLYAIKDFSQVAIYVNTDEQNILEVWLVED